MLNARRRGEDAQIKCVFKVAASASSVKFYWVLNVYVVSCL